MCGIAGIISKNTARVNQQVLVRMNECLAHRGPDGRATWIDSNGSAGFSHTRLSVIDTSTAAAQPMHYSGRYTIVFNGEIYNYIEIKDNLVKAGFTFQTSSDTEVILAAYSRHGEKCVTLFDGMFAFAIWDNQEQTLFCARDRFGEKPFYYSEEEGFYFASEIKALVAAGLRDGCDHGMVLQFLGTGRTIDPAHASRTFYTDIKKLPAAHYLQYDLKNSSLTLRRYWDASKSVTGISLEDALERLNELITVSLTRRLRSDVPLGTSLSGGLDSSTIAAKLSMTEAKHLKTFTASFPGFERDESAKAGMVADRFGLLNYQVSANAEGLADEFDKITWYHDEPVASASVYAQYKVFELAASNQVTVLLDGQGADEIFGGYDHYRRWKLRTLMPHLTATALKNRERKRLRNGYIDDRFFESAIKTIEVRKPVVRELNDLLYFDTFCSGLEQLLRYADRNSMAHGREVRLPFLFHELVSFVFSLPSSFKIQGGYTKWVLRKLMESKIPDEVVWQKRKVGFEPPQKIWMQSARMQEYLRESKEEMVRQGILNKVVLDQRPSSNEAHEKRADEWRWMACAAFLKNKKGV